jgi:hypothetical protein
MAGLTPVFCALLVQALVQNANSLIPAPCATAENLASKECCPMYDDPCGESQGRGKCETVTITENTEDVSSDIRYQWPKDYSARPVYAAETTADMTAAIANSVTR